MRRYTIRQLATEVQDLLASRYPKVEVEAEISQLTTPASGHAYLTLRDGGGSQETVLPGVVWRNVWRNLSFQPKVGDRVLARGHLGLFASRSSVQLYVHDLAPAGQGALAAEIAKRRARLEADGLLDPRRKRPLPAHPRFIGVATSPTGAALQDFLKVSRERFPGTRLLVAGCVVQGAAAPASVVQAVELLIEDGRAEVIVVTRGGGAKEDLLAFQDEGLARYLAGSPVPIVSAVGHQIDTTLADLVADAVAPTPSAAAVLVLPDGQALAQRVDDAQLSLEAATGRRLRRERDRVEALRARLRHPGERLRGIRQRARVLEERLEAALRGRLLRLRDRSEGLLPRAERAMQARLSVLRGRVERLDASCRALSPQSVLDRGYAVVLGADGWVARKQQLQLGDALRLRFADGSAVAEVMRLDEEEL